MEIIATFIACLAVAEGFVIWGLVLKNGRLAAGYKDKAAVVAELAQRLNTSLAVNEKTKKLIEAAIPEIKRLEEVAGRSGANKREYVRKELERKHPDASPRDISLAIEKGVQEVDPK